MRSSAATQEGNRCTPTGTRFGQCALPLPAAPLPPYTTGVMIFSLTGTITHLLSTGLVLDVGGIGYLLSTVPATNGSHIVGERITLYTHHHIREDEESLYGFESIEHLEFFKTIISISKIGPKLGLLILSSAPMDRLIDAISTGDAAVLSAVPGVGKKTAERVILELKDKVGTISLAAGSSSSESSMTSTARKDATDALVQLGYSTTEAREALDAVATADIDLSSHIKSALQYLGRGRR